MKICSLIPTFKKNFLIILLSSAVIVLPGLRASAQFYYPDSVEYQTPEKHGLKYESVTFKSKDGTKLHGWFVPAVGKAIATVIHFHGNAQNLSSHFSFVRWLPEKGFNLFVFDYRGYGKSEGKPDREGVHEDGVAALNYIRARKDIDPDKLFVFGQSLGGAVAIRAIADAGASGIRAVVLESTFDSYTAIAKEKAPDLLASLFISDKLSPDDVIADLSPVPMLFIHGTSDRIVPYARGKRLFDLAKEPKELWTIKNGRHTEAFTTYVSIYQPKLVEFFKQCLKQKS